MVEDGSIGNPYRAVLFVVVGFGSIVLGDGKSRMSLIGACVFSTEKWEMSFPKAISVIWQNYWFFFPVSFGALAGEIAVTNSAVHLLFLIDKELLSQIIRIPNCRDNFLRFWTGVSFLYKNKYCSLLQGSVAVKSGKYFSKTSFYN